MTVIIESITIPETGRFEINRTVDIGISADQARRRCNHWLGENVGDLCIAQDPTLHVGFQTVWRLNVMLTATHVGIVGQVGCVDVNVENGEISSSKHEIAKMLQRSEQLLEDIPAFAPQTLPKDYLSSVGLD